MRRSTCFWSSSPARTSLAAYGHATGGYCSLLTGMGSACCCASALPPGTSLLPRGGAGMSASLTCACCTSCGMAVPKPHTPAMVISLSVLNVQTLLDFSRMGSIEKTRVDIGELFREVVEMLGTLGQYRCKTLRTDCPDAVTAMVNGQQIRQVALNLLTNALESVDQDGAVDIRIRQERDLVVVTVQDDGCGMTDEVLEHLFEPFFTRRRDGKGTGLGLSITHRIVTQHGGKLTAHSEGLGRGSQMRLELPVEAAETADAQKRAAPKLSETNITTKSEYAPLEAVNQKDPRDERRRVA